MDQDKHHVDNPFQIFGIRMSHKATYVEFLQSDADYLITFENDAIKDEGANLEDIPKMLNEKPLKKFDLLR